MVITVYYKIVGVIFIFLVMVEAIIRDWWKLRSDKIVGLRYPLTITGTT